MVGLYELSMVLSKRKVLLVSEFMTREVWEMAWTSRNSKPVLLLGKGTLSDCC